MKVTVTDSDTGRVLIEWEGYAENAYDALPRAMMAVEDGEVKVHE